jgi:hypothetical protein
MRTLPWWELRPAQGLLAEQPGDETFNHFISVARTDDARIIVAYLPIRTAIKLYNRFGHEYRGEWFNPVSGDGFTADVDYRDGLVEVTSPQNSDMVLTLIRR